MRSDMDNFDVAKTKVRHVVRVHIETREGLREPMDIVCVCNGGATDHYIRQYAIRKAFKKCGIPFSWRMDSLAEIIESTVL
jgi:hypothetical protein